MRLRRLAVVGVPGIHDTSIDLPDEKVIALAGPNGTGKTRLLSAIGGPWGLGSGLVASGDPSSEIVAEFDGMPASSHAFGAAPDTRLCWRTDLTQQPMVRVVGPWPSGSSEVRDIQMTMTPTEPLLVIPAGRLFPVSRMPINLQQPPSSPDPNSIPRWDLSGHRMEDGELEQIALDAYVRAQLPGNSGEADQRFIARWEGLRAAMNTILAPKFIEPPTPDSFTLKVCSPTGLRHQLEQLSMGEQQALGIVGLIARHGWRNGLLLIDEPDAFLHPRLAARLVAALKEVLGDDGQLVMATHSPSILDSLPASAIVRLSHEKPATIVGNDPARIQMYRDAGFRASALSQAESLLITEGELDLTYLPLLSPMVAAGTTEQAQGRAAVIHKVAALASYDLPVLGVVDGDAFAKQVPEAIAERCIQWAFADLEAVLLADEQFLRAALEGRFFNSQWTSVDQVIAQIAALTEAEEDSVVAELAIRTLEERTSVQWPSTTGGNSIPRLLSMAGHPSPLTGAEIQGAIDDARDIWAATTDKLVLVRGKRLAGELGKMIRGAKARVFFEQVAAQGPRVAEVERLEKLIVQHRLT